MGIRLGSYLITVPYYSVAKTIGSSAFNGCSNLTSFTIPSSIKTIENGTFWNCFRLTSISIPNSVTSISGAFGNCSGLTSIILPNSVTYIGDNTFFGCTGLTSITIPNSVTSIGEAAFEDCSLLLSINIPKSVTHIGSYAFYYCSGLMSIYANSSIPIDLTNISDVFYTVSKTNCILYVPIGSKTSYQNAEQWKDFLKIVEKSTDIQTVSATELGISIERGDLVLKNLQLNEMIQIFTLDGRMVFSENATHELINIPLLKNKMYIVKVGMRTAKIVL